MPEQSKKRPLVGDDKVVHTPLHGLPATRWRKLLRAEGGTERYHLRAAIELYIKEKGYADSVSK